MRTSSLRGKRISAATVLIVEQHQMQLAALFHEADILRLDVPVGDAIVVVIVVARIRDYDYDYDYDNDIEISSTVCSRFAE